MTIYWTKGVRGNDLSPTHSKESDFKTFYYLVNNYKYYECKPGASDDELNKLKANDLLFFLAGDLKDDSKGRNDANMVKRTLIILDLESAPNSAPMPYVDMMKLVDDKLAPYNYIAYPTLRNSLDNGRIRVVVEPSKPMTKDETEATTKVLYSLFPSHICDQSSSTYSQLQGLPVDNKRLPDYLIVVNLDGKPYPVKQGEGQPASTYQPMTSSYSRGKKYTALLFEEIMQGVEEGNRDNWLTRIAGKLIALGTEPTIAYNWLFVINDNFVSPPLAESDINRIFKSIFTKEQRKEGLND